MSAYNLPKSLFIGDKKYAIESDFRAIIDILIAISDPDLNDMEKQEVMFRIFYPEYQEIPSELKAEACEKAVQFIDYNLPPGKPKPKTMDWEQDAQIIIPAVNRVAGKEVRALEYMHWWTFLGYFMEISEGIASLVWSIRQKKAKGKKLEKWEREFARDNADLVNLKTKYSQEQQKEISSIEKWL